MIWNPDNYVGVFLYDYKKNGGLVEIPFLNKKSLDKICCFGFHDPTYNFSFRMKLTPHRTESTLRVIGSKYYLGIWLQYKAPAHIWQGSSVT